MTVKYHIQADLLFDTAFRIGSGRGLDVTDLPILRDTLGDPLLPGSSLKGLFRSTAEKLAPHLGLSACLLDYGLSGVKCYNALHPRENRELFQSWNEAFQNQPNSPSRLAWIEDHTCDVCKLFGSHLKTARIRFEDAQLLSWAGMTQIRDGVVLDRDSGTAVDGFKYDFEVVPAGAQFKLNVYLENPSAADLALIGVVMQEFELGGAIGGFTSRGLGHFHLANVENKYVDLTHPQQRVTYLVNKTMQPAKAWSEIIQKYLQEAL